MSGGDAIKVGDLTEVVDLVEELARAKEPIAIIGNGPSSKCYVCGAYDSSGAPIHSASCAWLRARRLVAGPPVVDLAAERSKRGA